MTQPAEFTSITAAAEHILQKLGNQVVMATPLGLGKPNQLINEIYLRICADPTRELRLFTALSLAVPKPGSDLEGRFLAPFSRRQWGEDYPELLYLQDLEARRLPPNIRVHEFYLQAGKSLSRPEVQRDYVKLQLHPRGPGHCRSGRQCAGAIGGQKSEAGGSL